MTISIVNSIIRLPAHKIEDPKIGYRIFFVFGERIRVESILGCHYVSPKVLWN